MVSIIKFLKIVPILILLSMACDQKDVQTASSPPDFLKDNKLHTILLTNSNQQQALRDYYFALLLIKQNYPNKNIEINIFNEQENTNLVHAWHISKFPALIVIKSNKTLLNLDGVQNWKDIYQQMTKTVANNSVKLSAEAN